MLIDTHCHLDFKDFDTDRDDVIDRAISKGAARIINVGSSLEGTRRSLLLAKKYDIVYASVGIHPHEANSVTDDAISEIRELAKEKKVVAIGEVGLDYYPVLIAASPLRYRACSDEIKDIQQAAFRRFIQLALDLDLPLIIHSREADVDIIKILNEYAIRDTQYGRRTRGVIHCFSGGEDFLKECLGLGFYISFTGNLTFKKAQALRDVAKIVPIERVLLETDAPYLSPEPLRGKRNEPAYLEYLVAEWVRLTGLSKEDIERITTHNANDLFKLNLREGDSRISYEIRDSLYLNITNECTNNCYFCVRARTSFVKGHNLRLDKEPSVEEILKATVDAKRYKEVVFCGYGEPTKRLDAVKAVARWVKGSSFAKASADRQAPRVRLITNGHGDLINGRPIAKELVGLVDKVSVSLNTDKEDLYYKACKPVFGHDAYKAVIKFIRDCAANGIKTEVTCLNLPGVDLGECERIAKNLGASFRARTYGVTG
ncbi:MAG: YchF/TatD family DNA exonuclease [Candidatus Omnitrophota bacterium]|nr:YchF/TatD family DNA exonuclease [Candidatus Omnitrophota bacterium]